jgi:putative intracellular protease/amidase
MAAAKKVLMVLTNHAVSADGKATGWYLPECAHPYFRFKKAGMDISFASIDGGNTTVSPSSLDMSDAENKLFWETEETKALTQGTKKLADFKGTEFDVVFFVGGFGVMFDFYDNEHVNRVSREVYEQGGIVGAVCHGPIALAQVKLSSGEFLISGKGCAGFTNEEEDQAGLRDILPMRDGGATCGDVLSARGAKYTKGDPWGSHVVSDSRVVTGQNPASAGATADAILAALA